FWGAVKKYLRDNCDYTFATLKENMPKAQLHLFSAVQSCVWEHRMYQWMEAYRSGLGTTEAQIHKTFSSREYKSHIRIPDTVAHALNAV
ncbi:hypothetical protein DFJ58DRAFT_667458, partial [Suillus subalutaceus]|uniref:uncharacterized protein n=1 Tax=Suillus subalutaceus TaxID=48586 RepID=UPI001B87A294